MKIVVVKGVVTDEKGKDFAIGESLEIDNDKAKRLISLGFTEKAGSDAPPTAGPEKSTESKK